MALLAAGLTLGAMGGCVARQGIAVRASAPASQPFGNRSADPSQEEQPPFGATPRRPLRQVDQAALRRACGDGCSDYDLGILWAEREGITTAEECMGYSWSYQRGCLTYLREGHGRRASPDLSAS